jgi:hypothetical protein
MDRFSKERIMRKWLTVVGRKKTIAGLLLVAVMVAAELGLLDGEQLAAVCSALKP